VGEDQAHREARFCPIDGHDPVSSAGASLTRRGARRRIVAPFTKGREMDPFKTPGAFSWTELTTKDPKQAAEFYGTLFGWKVEAMDMGTGPYHVLKVGDAAIGGIMSPPPGAPAMPSNWCPYVTVTNTDETAAKCVALGGRLCAGPMDIPSVGRFAVLQDPQGAVLNIIAYTPQQ
jgi:uncharacterized protein